MDLNGTYNSNHVLNAYADSVLEGIEATASWNNIPRLDPEKLASTVQLIKSNALELDQLASSYFTRILNGIDAAIHNRNDRDSALNNAYTAASALHDFFVDKPVLELKSAAMYLNSTVGELRAYNNKTYFE